MSQLIMHLAFKTQAISLLKQLLMELEYSHLNIDHTVKSQILLPFTSKWNLSNMTAKLVS